jgi:gamma-glutamylcyclotransferase (GGCT)/AIG2-like uncharacterized protein YtfP
MKAPIFVYGTLCSPQVVQILLGRSILPSFIPAKLTGHSRYPVRGFDFPGTIATPHQPLNSVDGFLLLSEGLSPRDYKLFDYFEGREYERVMVSVERQDTKENVQAHVYLWKTDLIHELELEKAWDYTDFEQTKLQSYLETTVRPCRHEMERLGMTNNEDEEDK